MATKELTNNEFNDKVFTDIKKHEDKIIALKATLKRAAPIQNASLAECNALQSKGKK